MDGKHTKENTFIRDILNTGCKNIIECPNVNKCFSMLYQSEIDLLHHSLNVAVLSVFIGLHVLEEKSEINNLFISGLLHDIGKLYIPKRIINKSGKLTMIEKEVIRTHTVLGYRMLKKSNYFDEEILLGVLDHHERLDGSGYGGRKTNKEISKLAKIIMIADVFDAMNSDRVYRPSLKKEQVYGHLIENAGRYYSKAYIMCFIENTKLLDLNYILNETRAALLKDCSLLGRGCKLY